MNALASYLRHLIVTGLVMAVEKLGLPTEGLAEGADVVALAVVGTLSWLAVKYVAPYLKPSTLPLIALCGILAIGLPSCGASFSISGPLPDNFGGGNATITITPEK